MTTAHLQQPKQFVRHMDKFFDCLNVRSLSEWSHKKKPDRKPYTSSQDERFKGRSIIMLV